MAYEKFSVDLDHQNVIRIGGKLGNVTKCARMRYDEHSEWSQCMSE